MDLFTGIYLAWNTAHNSCILMRCRARTWAEMDFRRGVILGSIRQSLRLLTLCTPGPTPVTTSTAAEMANPQNTPLAVPAKLFVFRVYVVCVPSCPPQA